VANNADVQDDNGHGTHVSGIIAAAGNNGIGVAGVNWNAEIMPLKVLDQSGNGRDDATVAAINFAVQHGARVINASWGGGPYSQAVADAISAAGSHGVIFVTAAGNNGSNDDTYPFYPASYQLPNEIAVAAVDAAGNLASYSNYGARTVALAAPGTQILSTVPGGYAFESGTSMAAPFVSGVVSLVVGLHPTYTAAQVVNQVLTTTKPLASLAGRTTTGGIVDAAGAVGAFDPRVGHASRAHGANRALPVPPAPGAFAAFTPGSSRHRHPVRQDLPGSGRPRMRPAGVPVDWPRRFTI
jgi:subtilisin family serine protease